MEKKTVRVEWQSKRGARRKGNLVEHDGRYRKASTVLGNRDLCELTLCEDDPRVLPAPAIVFASSDGRFRVVRTVEEEGGEDRLVLERRVSSDAMGAPVWANAEAPDDLVAVLLELAGRPFEGTGCHRKGCRRPALLPEVPVNAGPASGAFCLAHELKLQGEVAGADGDYFAELRHDVVVVTREELVRHAETPQRCARCGGGIHQLQVCPEPLPPPEGA